MAGLFFEVVIEDCLVVCNRLPRPLVLRLLDSESARAQSQSQSQAGVVSTQHTAAALQPRASDVVIEAGGEVSLPADPSRVCVVFGQHVSRPISVAYQMQGVGFPFTAPPPPSPGNFFHSLIRRAGTSGGFFVCRRACSAST